MIMDEHVLTEAECSEVRVQQCNSEILKWHVVQPSLSYLYEFIPFDVSYGSKVGDFSPVTKRSLEFASPCR